MPSDLDSLWRADLLHREGSSSSSVPCMTPPPNRPRPVRRTEQASVAARMAALATVTVASASKAQNGVVSMATDSPAGASARLALVSTPCQQPEQTIIAPAPSGKSAVVIGAGISGLKAAIDLKERGYTVTIIEARDRVGGRCWSAPLKPWGQPDRDDASYDPPLVDCGASYIHGTINNPLTQLSEDQRFSLFEPRGAEKTPIFDYDGQLFPDDMAERIQNVWDNCLDESKEFVSRVSKELRIKVQEARAMSQGVSLGEVLNELLQRRRLDPQERRLLEFHRANMEFANAATLSELAHSSWDQGDKYAFGGPHSLIKEGFGALCQALQMQLDSACFRFSTVVTRIDHSSSSSAYCHENGGTDAGGSGGGGSGDGGGPPRCKVWTEKAEVFVCDQVLVTVPLGVLKAECIAFQPRLAPAKLEAIHRLGCGAMNKIFVEFSEPFWRRHPAFLKQQKATRSRPTTEGPPCYFGYTDERLPGRFYLSLDLTDVQDGRPILMAILQANHAKAAESKADDVGTTVAAYLRVLRRIFGSHAVPEPVAYLVTKWGKDPYARGAYTFVPPGGQEGDMDTVAEPIGDQVFFAGEHTSTKHPATVHGAYLSGQAAAEKMDGALRGRERRQSLRASAVCAGEAVGFSSSSSPPSSSPSSSSSCGSSGAEDGKAGEKRTTRRRKAGQAATPVSERRRLRSEGAPAAATAAASFSASLASSWSSPRLPK